MSVIYRIASKPAFSVLIPLLLSFASLELFDRFNLFGPVPMTIAAGFYLTASY
jgi:hypothetical protein